MVLIFKFFEIFWWHLPSASATFTVCVLLLHHWLVTPHHLLAHFSTTTGPSGWADVREMSFGLIETS